MGEDSAARGPEQVQQLLRRGIDAAKAGDRARAREILMRVVELDEAQIAAWLWLSGAVDGLDDREVCLQNVLTLDPDNRAARQGLDWIRAQRRKQQPVSAQGSASMARAAASPVQSPSPKPLWNEPPDPLLCPYCASRTEQADRRCPGCGKELWIKVRRRETHSLWLWNLMVVRFSLAILYALMPVVALTVVSYILIGEFDPLPLLPQYLGLQSKASPEVARAAFDMLPRAYLLPLAVLSLYSFALLAGMYLRWRPVFYLLLGGVAVRFALAVTAAVLGHYYGLICGGFGIGIGIASFFIVISVQDDFSWDSQRVYLQLDRKSTGGAARLEHARAFADKGMWALAVLYLRAAVAKMPGHAAGYVRLAHAYLRLGRSDLAQDTLSQAVELDPSDPAAAQLTELLREEQPARVPGSQAGCGSPTVRSKVH